MMCEILTRLHCDMFIYYKSREQFSTVSVFFFYCRYLIDVDGVEPHEAIDRK